MSRSPLRPGPARPSLSSLLLACLLSACVGVPRGPDGRPLAPLPVPPPTPRDPDVDIENYEIHVDLDLQAGHVAGEETITFRALPDRAATRLQLDAVELDVSSARDDAGRELACSTRDDVLTVALHDPLPPAAEGRVTLDWSCWPRRGMYFVGPSPSEPTRPWHCWTQGQTHETRYWVPVRDFPDDRATHSLAITVDDRYLTLAAGRRLSSRRDDATGRRTDSWALDVPHSSYLITLVAGDLGQAELPDGHLELPVVTDAAGLPAAQANLAVTSEMLALLSDFAGRPYPYPKYAQTLVHDFVAGGQENISATTLTRDTLHAAQDGPQEDEGTEGLAVHELMHQWFGDLLTCRDWSHLWLNEGFATWAEMLWMRHREGDEAARALVLGWQREMVEHERTHPDPVVQPHYEDPDDDLFDTPRYDGAGGRLWLLAQELGEDTFTAGVRRYVHEHEAQDVVTDDLRTSLEAASGRDLRAWFAEWIEGTGFPSLQVRIADDGGSPRLVARQVQTPEQGHAVFHFPVQVQWSRGGGEHDAQLAVDAAHVELPLNGDGPLDWVRFDGQCALPGDIDLAQPEACWCRQLRDAHDGVTRLVAAQWFALDPAVAHGELAAAPLQTASLSALEQAARHDSFHPVRTTALAALAARAPADDPAAARALLDLAADADPRVRSVAAQGLAERGGTEGAESLARLAADANGEVAGAALESLVQRRDPRAVALGLPLATDKDPLRAALRQTALTALAHLPDEPRVSPLLVAAAHADPAPRVRAAMLRLLHGRADLPPDVGFRILGEALWDTSFTVRAAAARALRDWPDSLAGPLLAARGEIELDATVRHALQSPRHAAPADD